MKRQFSMWLVGFIALFGLSAAAQQAQTVPATPATPRTTATAGTYVDPAVGGQVVNIRLDVSISDQAGPSPAQPKVLTLLLADRTLSQVRTNFEDRTIRMDARPTIVEGKIKLSLTMDSIRIGAAPSSTLSWNQSLTVIVENGKALVVVENSDPANSRKLSVEVKATILK